MSLNVVQAEVIGLGIAYAPYHAAMFRAEVKSTDRGQFKIDLSNGRNWGMMMGRVILPAHASS